MHSGEILFICLTPCFIFDTIKMKFGTEVYTKGSLAILVLVNTRKI